MTRIEVAGVNVGLPTFLAERGGERVYSAIRKHPVAPGSVLWLSTGNLAGDAQADLSVHGGPDKAVYTYPTEHLRRWSTELGETVEAGAFGENLSTRGALETEVRIGDIWRWSDALLQVSQPLWPCFKLALYRKSGVVQNLMRSTGRTGWYLRVLRPGEVVVGADIEVVERDGAALTARDAHEAMRDRDVSDRGRIEALVSHDALANAWREPFQARIANR